MSDKRALRKEAKIERAAIPAAVRLEKSAAVLAALSELPAFQKAAHIFCFVSFRAEVETKPIIEHLWRHGKQVYIPYIHESHTVMRASQLRSFDELEIGYYGVMEQKHEFVTLTPADTIDLILTPGLLFDRDGYRIGYGGGYYDGFFASLNHPVVKIGICFEEQIRAQLPHDEHDVPVDLIVTDERVYRPGYSGRA